MITGIKYVSPTFDHSGYGEASRNYILGLKRYTDIPITLQRLQFEKTQPDNYGEDGRILFSILNIPLSEYNVKIIHATPEHYPLYRESGKFNIGFLYWETSSIPRSWVDWINNSVDAQFVVCNYTRDSLINSGVNPNKVFIVSPIINISESYIKNLGKTSMPGIQDDWYKFYSIFQWTERKNPEGLIKAYISEFTREEPVVLIIKSYFADITSIEEKNSLINMINGIKQNAALKSRTYPKISLIYNLMTRDEIFRFHNSCDCYVSAHRSEGIGYPMLEAFALGKPIITSSCGGNMEFTTSENSYLVDYFLTPVCNMPWIPWYSGDMFWGEPDLYTFKNHMRYVYEHRDEAAQKGLKGQQYVLQNYNSEVGTAKFVKTIELAMAESDYNGRS